MNIYGDWQVKEREREREREREKGWRKLGFYGSRKGMKDERKRQLEDIGNSIAVFNLI